ncbi:MAG TPA: phosphatidylserine/phosphatidylglycerophosphate/cardiolipin synthase family protein [Holophagaceae bacterium]|nr:phosphatidylserine/phosphatidylglycerophosphate/cardiolipin synthase family protein [Holophagaceae bacterium]
MPKLLPDPLQAARARFWLRGAHRHGMPLREGNAAGLLPGGDAILDACLALIRGARRDLRFEMYIWSDDAAGRELALALRAALDRGVAVRGLVDAVGSWGSGAMVAELRAAGADLRWFHPVAGWRPKLWNRRNHRKLLIADGMEAIVGSANWGLDYRMAENPKAFLDLGVVLRGPSVADLGEDFRAAWRRSEHETPPPPEPGMEGPIWPGPWREGALVQVVSSAAPRGQAFLRRHFRLLLSQVRAELWVANAYFIPGFIVLRRLRNLARRGRRVILLLPGASDQPFVQAASRHVYGALLEAGVRIFEREHRMLHAKAALLDGEALFTGSANLDPRSFRHNLELNVLVRQPEIAAEARALFEAQLPLSKEREAAAWPRRPAWARAWSWFAYQFRWWL